MSTAKHVWRYKNAKGVSRFRRTCQKCGCRIISVGVGGNGRYPVRGYNTPMHNGVRQVPPCNPVGYARANEALAGLRAMLVLAGVECEPLKGGPLEVDMDWADWAPTSNIVNSLVIDEPLFNVARTGSQLTIWVKQLP